MNSYCAVCIYMYVRSISLSEAADILETQLGYDRARAEHFVKQFDRNDDGKLCAAELDNFKTTVHDTYDNPFTASFCLSNPAGILADPEGLCGGDGYAVERDTLSTGKGSGKGLSTTRPLILLSVKSGGNSGGRRPGKGSARELSKKEWRFR